MTDAELMRAYVGGDGEAFEALVGRHVDMVHGVATREAGADAEDVTQAVFLLLARKAKGLTGRGSIAGWLFYAARLCARNARRGAKRRRRYEREAAMRSDAIGREREEEAELVLMLDEGIAALGAEERELVLLRHLENRELVEIAAGLGISPAAASKRLQRAVAKLRAWFGKRGREVSASGVTGVLAAAGLHKAPAGLAVGGSGAASGGAVALAKSAGGQFVVGPLKILAAILVVCAGVGVGVALWDKSVAKVEGPAATMGGAVAVEDESKVGGDSAVACFDMLVDEEVAEALRGVCMPVQTESKAYAAYRGGNEAVLEKLRAAVAGGKEISPEIGNVAFDWPSMMDATYAYSIVHLNTTFQELGPNGGYFYGLSNSDESGTANVRRDAPGVTMDVKLKAQIGSRDEPSAWKEYPGEIQFSGRIAAGESVIFLASAGAPGGRALEHVVVWQVFKALHDQQEAVEAIQQLKEWVLLGPTGARRMADRSLLWRDGGVKPEDGARGKFVVKLANGAEVRLVGVGRPAEMPMCWWSAEGERVDGEWTDSEVSLGTKMAVAIAWKSALPAGLEGHGTWHGDGRGSARYWEDDHGTTAFVIGRNVEGVDFGVSAGAWKDVGDLLPGGELKVGEVEVRMGKVFGLDEGKGSMPVVAYKCPVEMEVRVLAVEKGGVRVGGMDDGRGVEDWPAVRMGKPREGKEREISPNMMVAVEAVDHYVVQTRRMEWARFEDFAEEPKERPPEGVDAGRLAVIRQAKANSEAELNRRQEEGDKAAEVVLEAKGEEFVARADATTPRGAMGVMIRDARTGDEAGLLKMFATTDKEQAERAKAVGELLFWHEQVWVGVKKRFSIEEIEETFMKTHLLFDVTDQLLQEWVVNGDKAQQAGVTGGFAMKRVGAEWRVDGTSLTKELANSCAEWPVYEEIAKRMAGNEFKTAEEMGAAMAAAMDKRMKELRGKK